MVNVSRLALLIAGPCFLNGCISTATAISDTHRLISADPIQTDFPVTIDVNGQATPVTLTAAAPGGYAEEYLGLVLIDSGTKCQEFADRLSTAQRGVDTSFDILSGILSALATAFTPLSTVHALTAGATISTGTKSAIAADVYAKATAPLILQQINNTYYVDIDTYRKELLNRDPSNIVPALEVSKIQAIHRKCSLDSAIASLSQAGTVTAAALGALSGAAEGAKSAGSKGLSTDAGAIAGAAVGAAAGAAGAAATGPEAAAKQGAAAAQTVGTAPPPGPAGPPAPGPSGAPPSASLPRAGAGPSPAGTGRTTANESRPSSINKCADPTAAAEIAKDKRDFINNILNNMNKEQLGAWLTALPTTSALRSDPDFKRGIELLPQLTRSPQRAINLFTNGINNSVCTRQQLNEVQSSVSSLR